MSVQMVTTFTPQGITCEILGDGRLTPGDLRRAEMIQIRTLKTRHAKKRLAEPNGPSTVTEAPEQPKDKPVEDAKTSGYVK